MVKDIRIIKYFCIIALSILLVGAHIVLANEAFKNSLMRMEFSKTSSGGVKINLFTGKSYKDNISVNKKSDYEYVILLPETSNSMTANPILNPVIGIVKGVSVKTQPYENQVKGYTKITITTLKPVEIVPQIQTIPSDYLLSENDYNELLSQTTKKNKATLKKELTKTVQSKKETININKAKSTLSIKKQKTKNLVQQPSSALLSKNVKSVSINHKQSTNPAIQTKTALKVKSKTTKTPQSPITPKLIEKTIPLQQTQNVVTPPIAEKNISTPVETQSTKLEPQQQYQQQPQTQPQLQTQTETQSPIIENPITSVQQPGKFDKYINIIKSNLYSILALISAMFILLLFGARKMTKDIKRQKETFKNNLEEKPASAQNFMDKINEDMTWREKYQTFKDASTQPEDALAEPINNFESTDSSTNDDLNELFLKEASSDNFPERNIYSEDFSENINNEETEIEIEQYDLIEKELLEEHEIPENEIYNTEEEFGQDKLDELFGEEENAIVEENNLIEEDFSLDVPKEKLEEATKEELVEEEKSEIIKSEFAIDSNKGFYLVDFEDSTTLVGHIEDEIFVLKQFGEKIEGTLQARINEQKANSANYMTRVGNFKALIEVTPSNMNLLIEL